MVGWHLLCLPKKSAETARDRQSEPALYPGGRGDFPFFARGDNSDVEVVLPCRESERRCVPHRLRRRTGCNRHTHTLTQKKNFHPFKKKRIKVGLKNRGDNDSGKKKRIIRKQTRQPRRFLPLRRHCGYMFAISTRTCYARAAPLGHPRVLGMAPARPSSSTRTFLCERRTSRPHTTAHEQWMGGPNGGVRRAKRAVALPPMVGERRRDPAISVHDH